jgi:hypothetical protein
MEIPVQVTLHNVGRLPQLIEEVREGAQILAKLRPGIRFCGITVKRLKELPDPQFEAYIALALPGQPDVVVSGGPDRNLCVVLRNVFGAAARAVPVAPDAPVGRRIETDRRCR